jgi:SAM-dependent methyltransferase
MSSESTPQLATARTSGELQSWSEDPLTARTRSIWSGADFLPIAKSFEPSAVEFIARLGLRPGETVLDVACGTGNLALPAARMGARVTGIDIAPNLITEAQNAAREAGLAIMFEVGDAEALPYGEGQFETTVSMFGAMFAPRPARAAAELVRVTRSGGRIAMANWVPDSFVGHLLRAHAAVVPPPATVPSPLLWGDAEVVRERLGKRVKELTCTRRSLHFKFPFPPAAVTELFATCYGPTVATLRAAGPELSQRLRDEMTRLWEEYNVAAKGATTVVGEYLDIQGTVI